MKLPFQLWIACGLLCAQTSVLDLLNHNLPVLDAHNCHPYEGQWNDRQMPLRSGFGSGARGPRGGLRTNRNGQQCQKCDGDKCILHGFKSVYLKPRRATLTYTKHAHVNERRKVNGACQQF